MKSFITASSVVVAAQASTIGLGGLGLGGLGLGGLNYGGLGGINYGGIGLAGGLPLNAGLAGLPLNAGLAGLPLNAGLAGLPLNAGLAGLPLNAGLAGLPLNAGLGHGLGYAQAPLIIARPQPIIPTLANQYQVQDTIGNTNYGYSNINSAQQESGNAYGGKTGSYSYVDPNGIRQRVSYIADDAGFRIIEATNLPIDTGVAPIDTGMAPIDNGVAPIDTGVAPEPVQDTPEVAAARDEHLAAVEAARAGGVYRKKRSLIGGASLIGSPYGLNAGLGYGASLGGLGYGGLGLGGLGYGGLLAAPAIIARPNKISGYSSTTINPIAAAGPLGYATTGYGLAGTGLGYINGGLY